MRVEVENGEFIDIPEVGKYDEHRVIFNGGGALYIKGKRKWTCPVCGGYTISEPWQNCICSKCGWEDDAGDCEMPDVAIGINPISLNQARELWDKYHDSYMNHKDEWKLTFGVPELDKWIEENAGKITEDDLLEKAKEYFGDPEDDDFEDEKSESDDE